MKSGLFRSVTTRDLSVTQLFDTNIDHGSLKKVTLKLKSEKQQFHNENKSLH